MNSASRRGAVILSGEITGLIALRGLSAAGVPVALVTIADDDIARHSRWAGDNHVVQPFQRQPSAALDLLERQADRWRGWALLPMSDFALEFLSQNRELLARNYAVAVPPYEVVRNVLSKERTTAAARGVGLDLPKVYGVADQATLERDDIVYPVVVKPNDGARFRQCFERKKLFIAKNKADLGVSVQELADAGLQGLVQDLVPGLDDAFYNYTVFLDERGDPAAELGLHKLRKSPPRTGVIRAGEVADVPQLREPTIELLRSIGWRGMASAEYKRDPRDGRFRLMEVNGRGFLPQGLALSAGVNYPLLTWRQAVLGDPGRSDPNGWNGVWVNLLEDIYHYTFCRKIEGLGLASYLSSYRRPISLAVWSRDDPKPFFAYVRRALAKAANLSLNARERAGLRARANALWASPR